MESCIKLVQRGQVITRRGVERSKKDSSHVQFVSCDFETQDWMESLQAQSDFDVSLPLLADVMLTISKICSCGKGSVISFD